MWIWIWPLQGTNKHATNYFQHRAVACWQWCLSGVKLNCFSVLWNKHAAQRKQKGKIKSYFFFIKNCKQCFIKAKCMWNLLIKKKSLPPSLIDVLKACLSGKSPEAFWNRQMTATRTTCHSSFLTTKRELGIRNVKVQGETKLVTVYWLFFQKGRVHTKLELLWKEHQNSPGFPITGNNLNLSNSSDSPVPQEAFLLTFPITIYPYYRNKALGQEAQVHRQLTVLT